MADNPFSQFAIPASSPAAPPDKSNPFAKFGGGKPPSFPEDDPNKEYGSIIPLAKDKTTGKLEMAVPEMIRAPIRGAVSRGRDLLGQGKAVGDTSTSPDELSAVSLGMTSAPGAGARGLPGALAPEKSDLRPGVQAAHEAGYVLAPAMMRDDPGAIASATAGWSGKIKTQQGASVKNQEITNGLAAKAFGLPEDTVFTDTTFSNIRKEAGRAYEAVANSIPMVAADDTFKSALKESLESNKAGAEYFPEIMSNPGIQELSKELNSAGAFTPRAGLDVVKQLRFEATQNLKSIGDPKRHALGLAQRQAADAVDSLIERNLETAATSEGSTVSPALVQQYKAARRIIAMSHDVEGATNMATGDVSALGLAKLQARGRPLSGELKTIADAGAAFPKALQNPAAFGGAEDLSAIDFFGSALSIAHGRPEVAGAILGRPIARKALLSGPVQNRMVAPAAPKPAPSGAADILGGNPLPMLSGNADQSDASQALQGR